jgi:hypothetical protein
VLLYNGQKKDTILLIAMLGMSASSLFFSFLINSFVHGGIFTVLNAMDLLVLAPLFALAAIFAMRGRAKVFIILACCVGFLLELVTLPGHVQLFAFNLEEETYLYMFTDIMLILAAVAKYVALLIFGIANTPPSLFGQTEC